MYARERACVRTYSIRLAALKVCIAVCRSVLQCVVVCCSVLQCVAMCAENMLWNVEALFNSNLAPLQVFSVCCRVLQGVALAAWSAENVLWNLDEFSESRASSGVLCVLHCIAVCCRTFQCDAVCSGVL